MLQCCMEKVKPIFDRVLLKAVDFSETQTGIIIPKTMDDRSHIMQVIEIGDASQVKAGDNVIVAKYAGTEVSIGAEKYTLVCEHDILGVVT